MVVFEFGLSGCSMVGMRGGGFPGCSSWGSGWGTSVGIGCCIVRMPGEIAIQHHKEL